jgi:hypothetical protein
MPGHQRYEPDEDTEGGEDMTTSTSSLVRFTDHQRANMRWWANPVRAPDNATVEAFRHMDTEGKEVTVYLYEGENGRGRYWWVVTSFYDGHERFTRGQRFGDGGQARRFYDAVS